MVAASFREVAVRWPRSSYRAASTHAGKQADNEQDDEYEEQNLGLSGLTPIRRATLASDIVPSKASSAAVQLRLPPDFISVV